jgi:DNA polymerase zeta
MRYNNPVVKCLDEKKKSSFKAESDEWGADHSSEIHIAGRVILNLWRILRHEVLIEMHMAFHS